MKVKHLSALAGVGVTLLISAPASAAFTGLDVVQITDWVALGNPAATQTAFNAAGFQTVQIFALFDNPLDNLLVLGAVNLPFTLSASDGFIYNNESGGFSPTARNGWDGPAPGSGFSTGGETIPYDSHTGIGLNIAPLRFGEADGVTPVATFGNGLNTTDGGVVVTPTSGDGVAGVGGSVFLMQITWNLGAVMTVNFDIAYDFAGDSNNNIIESNSVVVPAPGAFALLGLAGLVGRPRRRRG